LIEYKYNEKKYAEEILKKGFLTDYHLYELKILVKYFKSLGKKPKERKELIYQFCEKKVQDFNRVKYFKKINSALSYGSKKEAQLIIIERIQVTDSEIEYINNLDLDEIHKKVLFSLLVQNKIIKEISNIKYGNSSDYNFFGGKNRYYKEIHQISKIPAKYKIHNIINDLSNAGLIEVRYRGRINLLFVEQIPLSDNVVIEIDTFDNIGHWFSWYNGNKKIIKCDKCGKLIKQTSNRRQYCHSCWRKIRIEQQREWDRNYRKSDN